MNEREIKAEARLMAIEFVLNDLCIRFHRSIGATAEQIVAAHQKCSENLRNDTYPGADPVLSDLAAAEIEEAVSRLLAMQREMMGISQ